MTPRRMVLTTLAAAPLALAAAEARADAIKVSQTQAKAGTGNYEIGYPTIIVQGDGSSGYNKVVTTQIEAWVTPSSDGAPDKTDGFSHGSVQIEGSSAGFNQLGKSVRLTFPYRDPLAQSVQNQRQSPIAMCNDLWRSQNAAARDAFLRDGRNINYKDAYNISVSATWWGSGFRNDQRRTAKGKLNVRIVCRPLAGPQVRTRTTTTSSSRAPRASAPPPPTRTNPPPTRTNPPPVRTNPTPPPPPPPPPPQTGAQDLDVRIRGANRDGPGGTVQMWVYNSGPDTALGCQIDWQVPATGGYTRVATLPPIAARDTTQVQDVLPSDPDSTFRVQCANEPAAAAANNDFVVP